MLYIHRAERADGLIEDLAELLAQPVGNPMQAELVAVPTRGVERWLTQRLSHRLGSGAGGDGVCANVDFPFPGTVVGLATSAASGFLPEDDPWPPERSVWPLLGVIDQNLDEPFLAPLAAHLRDSSPTDAEGNKRLRRFTGARHLADLFDRYAVHRPEMVQAWLQGKLVTDPEQNPAEQWQAELWRRLRIQIGVPGPAERFASAMERLVDAPELVDLPERFSLFGLTRLPASHVRILGALGAHRDVHLFLLHPSQVLWDQVAAIDLNGYDRKRAGDPTADIPVNPLLRSWGRDAREMQLVLTEATPAVGEHRVAEAAGSSLLGLIQGDIRVNRRPPGLGPFAERTDPRPVLGPADDSLIVHSCHGRTRQVEVMRDAILHLLADDPSLELRDFIVMCPDIESFAPLIQAAFGVTEPEGDADLPVVPIRLADRAIRQTNPLLAVAAHLLDLSAARVTASQVLDLVSMEPVGRRFQIDEDDLGRLQEWVGQAGVRWGIDSLQRSSRGLADLRANTWDSGLDRLLLGVGMADDDCRLYGDIVPLDDVSGSDVDLAGRAAELIARLSQALHDLAGPAPIGVWIEALSRTTEAMALAATSDAWQHEQLRRILQDVGVEAQVSGGGGGEEALDLAEVRALFADRLAGRPTRANFRTGDLTICTLVPMRSVPHRVVCLLGLDDEVFPRHQGEDGDDLLQAEPQVGDREPRSEDRQLLLDALLAAQERVIITYSGRDPRTNQAKPPAVPVSELLDVVDRTVRVEADRKARSQVVVRHPLQSFAPVNFIPGALREGTPWSFDPVNLRSAEARESDRQLVPPFLAGPLPPVDSGVLDLAALVRFVEHPIKAFLRERMGLYLGEPRGTRDAIPLEMDGLEKWGVGDRLLAAQMVGASAEDALASELARGLLPPQPLAEAILSDVVPCVDELLQRFRAEPGAGLPGESYEVNVELADGRYLIGSVSGVRESTILVCTYSTLGPKHRLAAWVRFLALSASRPDLEVAAVSLGRGARSNAPGIPVARSEFEALPGPPEVRQKAAVDLLARLIDLYDRGRREPLPIFCKTSAAAVAAQRSGKDPVAAARHEWHTTYEGFPREDQDAEHVHIYGPELPFDRILDEGRRPEDPAGPDSARSRFALYARLLWDDVLDHPERLVGA
ncbi:MAG TPA: exodeoxyribonuclease V subunit gamma [Acidimicrobiales bacterium]|nr:exodeoxyribonuclease V subunit gamma [Acidimicrobiales bacterium]